MLEGKGNPDDGQGQGKPERDMADEDPKSRKDHPQKIANKSQRARVMGFKHLPKGRNRQASQFEALKAKRDPDDGEAQNQTGQKVFDGGQKTATKNRPKQIEKKIQRRRLQSKG